MTVASQVIIKSKIPKVVSGFSAPQMKSLKTSIGLRLQKAIKDRIKEGDSSWAPLSAEWAAVKGHGKPWYHTTRLEKAIEYEINDAGVRVGVLKHETYPETGSTVAIVGASLEYGTSKIPARPLFRPVFEEQVEDIVKDAAKDIKARIKKGAL